MAASGVKHSALFVCLGNICRSPIAEAVMRQLVTERGIADEWLIDSAATGDWHTGKQPDTRARQCMKDHNVPMDHRARQLVHDDFSKYKYIFGMDENNIRDIKRMGPKSHNAKIELLGKYDPEKQLIIRDPYYDDGAAGFEEVYVQCVRCCTGFLDQVVKQEIAD